MITGTTSLTDCLCIQSLRILGALSVGKEATKEPNLLYSTLMFGIFLVRSFSTPSRDSACAPMPCRSQMQQPHS